MRTVPTRSASSSEPWPRRPGPRLRAGRWLDGRSRRRRPESSRTCSSLPRHPRSRPTRPSWAGCSRRRTTTSASSTGPFSRPCAGCSRTSGEACPRSPCTAMLTSSSTRSRALVVASPISTTPREAPTSSTSSASESRSNSRLGRTVGGGPPRPERTRGKDQASGASLTELRDKRAPLAAARARGP
jgi:hypothetical protein